MTNLDKKFNKAYEIASAMTKVLPPDVMLHFYAYYKIGCNNSSLHMPSGNSELRNGFKLNALFQFNAVSADEAKEKYIALVEKYTNQKINL
ncbi:MAG: acyl-CoA-binding protein [Flavobacteriaceae bacterium]